MPAKSQEVNYAKVEYTPSPTLFDFHNSKAFVRGVKGPVGSGKSVGMCLEIFQMACRQQPDAHGIRPSRAAIVRNTMPDLKATTMKTWTDWFPPGNPKKNPGTFGEMTGVPPYTHHLKYPLSDGTMVDLEVIFLALDRPEDAKKLLSLEASFIWFNEAKFIQWDIVSNALGRVGRYPSVRRVPCTRKAIIMDTNPPDDESWWYERAVTDCPEGWEFWDQPSGTSAQAENLENLEQPANYKDLSLAERREAGRGYYKTISAGQSQEWIDVFVHGKYGFIKKGQPVFASCWNPDIHVAKAPIKINPRGEIHMGVDCSGRHPAAIFAQRTARGHWQLVHELCITDADGMGAVRFADLLHQEIQLKFRENVIVSPIWGDPAGDNPSQNDDRTYFEILNQALRGKGLRVRSAPNSLRWPSRYEAVEALLTQLVDGQPMLVVSPTCKVAVRGFNGGYMYKQISTAGGTRYDDKPLKNRFSDVQDAIQYLACGVGGLRNKLQTRWPAKRRVPVGTTWAI